MVEVLSVYLCRFGFLYLLSLFFLSSLFQVASAKTHRGATTAFQEFMGRFARFPKRKQRLVGVNKVLLFVRSIDRAERKAIGIELKEDYGANGLTEDWSKVGRVCQRLDSEWSARVKGKTRDEAPSQ